MLTIHTFKGSEAVDAYKQMVREIGLGFHPDTPAREYVTSSSQRSFNNTEVAYIHRVMECAEQYCDLYETGLDIIREETFSR